MKFNLLDFRQLSFAHYPSQFCSFITVGILARSFGLSISIGTTAEFAILLASLQLSHGLFVRYLRSQSSSFYLLNYGYIGNALISALSLIRFILGFSSPSSVH